MAIARSRTSSTVESLPARDLDARRAATFGSGTPAEFAAREIDDDPGLFFERLPLYPFTRAEKLQIAQDHAAEAYLHAHRFEMASREDQLELLVRLSSAGVSANALAHLGMNSQQDLLQLGRVVQGRGLFTLLKFAKLEKEGDRLAMATRLAELDPRRCLLLFKMIDFELSQDHFQQVVFRAVDHVKSDDSLSLDDHMDFFDDECRSEVMRRLASTAPRRCIESPRMLSSLVPTDRTEILLKLADADPEGMFLLMDRIDVPDTAALQDIFRTVFRAAIDRERATQLDHHLKGWEASHSGFSLASRFQAFTSACFPADPALPGFLAHLADLGVRYPAVARLLDAARNEPDPHAASIIGEWAHFTNLRLLVVDVPPAVRPVFDETLQSIHRCKLPAARKDLTEALARSLSGDGDEPAKEFADLCHVLRRQHSVVFRPLVSVLVMDGILDVDGKRQLAKLLSSDGMKEFHRRDGVINGLLALQEATMDPLEKRRLLANLTPESSGREDVKAFAASMQNLQHFLPLLNAGPALREQGLEKLPQIQGPAALRRVLGEMLFFILGRDRAVTGKRCTPEQFVFRLREYNDSLREPSPIVRYASNIYCGLPDSPEKVEVLASLNQYIDATVLADGPDEFRRTRNDTSKSMHLKTAMGIDPKATTRWLDHEWEAVGLFSQSEASAAEDVDVASYLKDRIVRDGHIAIGSLPILERVLKGELPASEAHRVQTPAPRAGEAELVKALDPGLAPADKVGLINRALASLDIDDLGEREEFHRDLQHLKSLLAPPVAAGRDFSLWRVRFKHDAEGYLGCGRVGGSCQDVDRSADNSQGLMGYVMQGKNRILEVTSSDGVLQARCLMRLGIDLEARRLVAHLERNYANAGVPSNCDEVMLDVARKVTAEIGVPLVTHSRAFLKNAVPCPHRISFLADTAVYEYVDAEGLRLVKSPEGYSLMRAFFVDGLPHGFGPSGGADSSSPSPRGSAPAQVR